MTENELLGNEPPTPRSWPTNDQSWNSNPNLTPPASATAGPTYQQGYPAQQNEPMVAGPQAAFQQTTNVPQQANPYSPVNQAVSPLPSRRSLSRQRQAEPSSNTAINQGSIATTPPNPAAVSFQYPGASSNGNAGSLNQIDPILQVGQPVQPNRNGLGVVGMVLGIIGLVLSVFQIPVLQMSYSTVLTPTYIALSLGIMALIFGLMGSSPNRNRENLGASRAIPLTGIITGSVVIGATGIILLVYIMSLFYYW